RNLAPLHLHSFPTRRSSDLTHRRATVDEAAGDRAPPRLVVVRVVRERQPARRVRLLRLLHRAGLERIPAEVGELAEPRVRHDVEDRKSTRLNSSHLGISYAV